MREATEALPDIRFLDEAARAAGVQEDWRDGSSFVMRGTTRNSVISHARSLERIEQLERENAEHKKYIRRKQDELAKERAEAKLWFEKAQKWGDEWMKAERQRDAALDALKVAKKAVELTIAARDTGDEMAAVEASEEALTQIDAITEGEGQKAPHSTDEFAERFI